MTLRRKMGTTEARPSETTVAILGGIEGMLTDLTRRPTRLSTFLLRGGLDDGDLESLRRDTTLDALILRLCPALRELLIGTLGMKAAYLLVEFYGLYGDERRTAEEVSDDLGMTRSHAAALRGWALKELRGMSAQDALRELAVSVARDVLEARG